jgi:hypothetical protein
LENRHLVEHGVDFRHHIFAIHEMVAPFRRAQATCRTARFSVMLIFSPLNIASIRPRKPDSPASCSSSLRVWSVMRFFE